MFCSGCLIAWYIMFYIPLEKISFIRCHEVPNRGQNVRSSPIVDRGWIKKESVHWINITIYIESVITRTTKTKEVALHADSGPWLETVKVLQISAFDRYLLYLRRQELYRAQLSFIFFFKRTYLFTYNNYSWQIIFRLALH